MVAQAGTPPTEPHSPVDSGMRKRVCKACDRCRLKKSKCDGLSVCSRCRADNAICVFGERKKSHDKVYPKGYVDMLEQQQAQLVAGLQELYRRTQSGEGWEGPPLKESSHGTPLTHDILERLGALKTGGQKSASERFEESPESLQQKLLANGAGLMQQAPSESGSESANSPTSDPANQKSSFTDPFSPGKLPPTPPSQSPFSQNSSPVFPMKNNISYYPSCLRRSAEDNLSQRQSWSSSGMGLDALLPQYDSPINMNSNPNAFDPSQMPVGTIAPYLSMRDWHHDVDFQRYFSAPTM